MTSVIQPEAAGPPVGGARMTIVEAPRPVVAARCGPIRQARPADRAALEAMHDRCSPASRIARWHAPIRAIPRGYLDEVTSGLALHPAYVAERGGELAGLASACLVAPGCWELGVLVEDGWQRRGVGRALVGALIRDVVARGGREIIAHALADRREVLAALRPLGPVDLSSATGVVSAVVGLAPCHRRGGQGR